MTTSESTEEREANGGGELRTDNFEQYLSENYNLFAIVGVFGALTVYLFNLRGQIPNRFVDWGVTGALLIFVVLSLILIYKTTHEVFTSYELGWVNRTLSVTLLTGLVGVVFAVTGMASQFLGKVTVLGMTVAFVVVYSVYLDIFPWEKFRETSNVSPESKEKIAKAPDIANTWAVTVILLSSIFLPDLPKVQGENPLILIPATILGLGVHLSLSFALRHRYISQDKSSYN